MESKSETDDNDVVNDIRKVDRVVKCDAKEDTSENDNEGIMKV